MIEFGPWSTTLAMGAAFGLAVALLLARSRINTAANRLLALLIVVFVLKLTPYIIGFAGFYDAYPWLSFAPFGAGLAIGPLLYLHLRRLTWERMPRGWYWHLLPAAIQLLYRGVMFVQPMTVKNDWNSRIHAPWIDPAETFLELLSFAVYVWLSIRAYRAYQGWLDAHLSNREEFRIVWLRNVLIAFALAWPVWAVYETLSYSIAFNYFQRFPLYVFFTGLVFYLGLEGWRHAGTRYPVQAPVAQAQATQDAAIEDTDTVTGNREAAAERDWPAQGRHWLEKTEATGWWRDPELSLERLARHLGTNTAYLSRALNEGLGRSFNDAINGLRVAEVCRRLRDGERGDLLALAFAAGFSSKTSFNRVFKAHTGKTPSQFRESTALAQTES
jgi:AraC-like DNA-binding protein